MADPVSGELVIVPDAEALGTITGNTYDWWGAIVCAEEYTDGTNSDYRLITKAEALAIFGNAELVSALELSTIDTFWTIDDEGDITGKALVWAGTANQIYKDAKTSENYALPIRKVNFYGLPLIESEFGGGLVFDVVAATRTVSIAARWEDIGQTELNNPKSWENVCAIPPIEIPPGGELFTHIPTRAQALKIFGNSYLVSLEGLPVNYNYWTSEEQDLNYAYSIQPYTQGTFPNDKSELFYALPVRSEVVPET